MAMLCIVMAISPSPPDSMKEAQDLSFSTGSEDNDSDTGVRSVISPVGHSVSHFGKGSDVGSLPQSRTLVLEHFPHSIVLHLYIDIQLGITREDDNIGLDWAGRCDYREGRSGGSSRVSGDATQRGSKYIVTHDFCFPILNVLSLADFSAILLWGSAWFPFWCGLFVPCIVLRHVL